MTTIQSGTIVFITGAFVDSTWWEDWKIYFEEKGYKTICTTLAAQGGRRGFLRSRQPMLPWLPSSLPDLMPIIPISCNNCPRGRSSSVIPLAV